MAHPTPSLNEQQIGQKILQKIINQQQYTIPEPKKQTGYLQQLQQFSYARASRLKDTILGDYYYKPKNAFKAEYKQKIFKYLQAKYMTTLVQLSDQKAKKFTSYIPSFGDDIQYQNLKHMKQVYLKMKTNIEAAQDNLKQSYVMRMKLKADYYNQVAYEFDRQRLCSVGWGLLLGSFICSTVYKRGNPTRKMALFLLMGYAFGQVSYYWNIDKYFDTVYPIFQQDALEYARQEQKEFTKAEVVRVPGESVVDD